MRPLASLRTRFIEAWTLSVNFGRFVEIGKKDAFPNNNLPMRPFDSNMTFSGVDLRELFKRRPEDRKETISEVVSLFQRNVIVPIKPVAVLPISQSATGLCKLRSGENMVIENGAHNVIVLGRRAASGPEVQKLLNQDQYTDVRVRAPV
ncbi:uncharacterized protein Z518_00188 [Rhinocladiella mackenziei CBS 650.93]|uniref:Uncharacterized protein n=1 Tax=Rhinocladiella mackenziei CBS 650.93 TaxID=1442369 RepID=A0A0D2JIA1_9EURO|nr:uncharacterized protein Z518_00188 [Rhinocladiella mackenziei CBS 650.93]KIX09110.1 hypothetical protein Z518_00188 [Rhinocladiella mackenziei CBS 650.93]